MIATIRRLQVFYYINCGNCSWEFVVALKKLFNAEWLLCQPYYFDLFPRKWKKYFYIRTGHYSFSHLRCLLASMALAQVIAIAPMIQSALTTVRQIVFPPLAPLLASALSICAVAIAFVPNATSSINSPNSAFRYSMRVAPIPPPCPSITQIRLNTSEHFQIIESKKATRCLAPFIGTSNLRGFWFRQLSFVLNNLSADRLLISHFYLPWFILSIFYHFSHARQQIR